MRFLKKFPCLPSVTIVTVRLSTHNTWEQRVYTIGEQKIFFQKHDLILGEKGKYHLFQGNKSTNALQDTFGKQGTLFRT